jgi:uncharacterized surface protein with fasciclin (FAS1) repeats
MSTRTTLCNWAVASAVAAMMATATSGAFAQMAPAPMSDMAPAPMSSDMSANMPNEYKILNNRVFDAIDLQQSRARGLSDDQIATIVKICKKTGLSYQFVSRAVQRGETFPELANTYNLRLGDIYNIDKEKQEIADYTSLTEAEAALSKGSGMTSMPMDTSAMSNTSSAPMTMPVADSNMATLDISDTISTAKNLSTLYKAIQIAGLVETLKGAGPFTVFAPNNQAFANLPAGALDALEADPAKLKQVLTYHVIPGSITASDAMAMTTPTSPPTVEGATLQVTKSARGRLRINNATVVKGDIHASNGVVHIINQVLMPPMDSTAPMAPAMPGQ